MFGAVIGSVMAAASFAIVGYVVYSYMTAPAVTTVSAFKPGDPAITRPSTIMDKLAYSTKRSASLFVSLIGSTSVMMVNGLLSMTDLFNAPEAKAWVTLHFTPEVASTVFLAFIALATYARVRNAMS